MISQLKLVEHRLKRVFHVDTIHIKHTNAVFIVSMGTYKMIVKAGDEDVLHEKVINFELYNKLKSAKKYIVKPLKFPHLSTLFPDINFHIMELIDGVPLREVLENGTLSKCGIEDIKKQLKFLFKEIWKLGYIHADLHTNNIMITPAGQIKLIDFGFTQRVDPFLPNLQTPRSWFKSQWPSVLELGNIPMGNPNIWVTGSMGGIDMFSKINRNLLKSKGFI